MSQIIMAANSAAENSAEDTSEKTNFKHRECDTAQFRGAVSNLVQTKTIELEEQNSANLDSELANYIAKCANENSGDQTLSNGDANLSNRLDQLKTMLKKPDDTKAEKQEQIDLGSSTKIDLIEIIEKQARQIEMLERLQKADAEKIKTITQENTMLLRENALTVDEKSIRISQIIEENREFEAENENLVSRLCEMREKYGVAIRQNMERQGNQFSRVRELESQLKTTKNQLEIKQLEFAALRTDHDSVNRLLNTHEQMLAALTIERRANR